MAEKPVAVADEPLSLAESSAATAAAPAVDAPPAPDAQVDTVDDDANKPAAELDHSAGDDKKEADDSKAEEESATVPTDTVDDIDMTKSAATTPARDSSPEAGPVGSDSENTTLAAGQEGLKTPLKSVKDRRKSGVASATKGKTLNKKASRAALTNLDVEPGEQFLVKLKGFPPWPVIIADEGMLPEVLTTHRPVSAKKTDGTWNEPFADGAKRINERKHPIMYLHTNEFGWAQNTMLQPLSTEKAEEALAQSSKMKKDLKLAFELATKDHSLDYYKNLISNFQKAHAEELAKTEARTKAAADAKAKGKKTKAAVDADGDLDMPDDVDDEGDAASSTKKSKKRKAEDDTVQTLQRTDSVKKPKIKLTSSATPKTSNGVDAKPSPTETAKLKIKRPQAAKAKPADVPTVDKKKREVLFLRHRLQRGMLTKDEDPKVEDMDTMSKHLAQLETFVNLDVETMRDTKINKVLKAILKLDNIPRDAELKFKERSAALLDEWNKLLAAAPASNGVNGHEAAPEDKGGNDIEVPDRTK